MANKFLLPIYRKVFEEDFSYADFNQRLKMQKMVYLLQEEGVNIGHYGFDWYKHGPYSQMLLDDMYIEKGTVSSTINYTDDVEKRIERLKQIFIDKEVLSVYEMKKWTECLASIHFLQKKIMGSNASKEEILMELKVRKPHLNNLSINEKAYELVQGLFE